MKVANFKLKEKEDSPVEHREENEENGNSPKGVEFGKENGRLQVDNREEDASLPIEDREKVEENGNSPQGVKFVKEGGGLQVDRGKKKKTDL